MRDHNAQRPVYILDAFKGESRVADEESTRRLSSTLHTLDIPHKVLEAKGGHWADHDVFLVPEEYKDQAFEIANGLGITELLYLAFDRTAWLQSDSESLGKPIGTLKPVQDDFLDGLFYFDHNRNQAYAVK